MSRIESPVAWRASGPISADRSEPCSVCLKDGGLSTGKYTNQIDSRSSGIPAASQFGHAPERVYLTFLRRNPRPTEHDARPFRASGKCRVPF